MPWVTDREATAQTDTTLVAAPGADRAIYVEAVTISVDGDQDVTLESGTSTEKLTFLGKAAGTSTLAIDSGRVGVFSCEANEALTWTSTGAVDTFVGVRYSIRRHRGSS